MADTTGTHPSHLEPSQLGTKEYWDSLYTTEISNHAANPSDTGTVWFSDSNAEAKILSHLASLTKAPPQKQQQSASSGALPRLSRETASFLDLGCGNGSLLLALRDADWRGPMLGVDYSPHSVALAKQIAAAEQQQQQEEQQQEEEDPHANLAFAEWDVLAGDYAQVLQHISSSSSTSSSDSAADIGYDVVLDKGTFDAISLSDETDAQGRRLCEGYRDRVLPLVKRGTGLFVLTSCNWTEEELRSWFVPGEQSQGEGGHETENGGASDGFEVASRVEYRTFSFGGVKGQTISTLCFRRTG